MQLRKKKNNIVWFVSGFFSFFLVCMYLIFRDHSSFDLDKIRPTRDFSLQTIKVASQEEIKNVLSIVSQPFNFLAEEEDCYVFESKDQNYVIRFFNMRKITPKYWLNYIPVPFLDKRRLSKIADRERNRQEIFSGLKNSFEHFRYQTGLVFLHLFRTEYLKTKILVIDKEGREHKIPLDIVPFVVQKKAKLLFEYIPDLLKEGKTSEALYALCRVLTIVKDECRQGFYGANKEVEAEFGFVEGRPIRVAIHSLKMDESLKSSRNVLKEVYRVSQSLEAWAERCCPEIATLFQDEVEDLLSFLEDE